MGDIGEECPECEEHLGVVLFEHAQQLVGEESPAETGLGAENQNDVCSCRTCVPQADGGPHDAAHPTVAQLDVRTDGGKVGEEFGVDFGEGSCAPTLHQVLECRRRGIGRVIPAGERGDDGGLDKVGFGNPTDVVCAAHDDLTLSTQFDYFGRSKLART